MPSQSRAAFVVALAIGCHHALAQTAVPPAVTVQNIAPQLVAFAGSQSNFENLVAGLAQGTPVQLVSVLPDGSAQVVSFTPAAALPPEQIAPTLEAARQRLIGLGIAAPTAEQIAFMLTGGTLPAAPRGDLVTGTPVPQNVPSQAAQMQGTTVTAIPSLAAPRINTSDSAIPAGATSRTPTLPIAPIAAPGAGSTPSALERAPPIAPANRPSLRH